MGKLGHLTFAIRGTGRLITLEARRHEALQETLERLHSEVAELHASRERLVLAADADRREIERALHSGVQQHLVALAVNLQLALQAADSDRAVVTKLLHEMQGDVQRALDETAELAQHIYPALLGARDLAALLRSAAASAGVRASIDVAAGSTPPEVARTVYLCWLDFLEHQASDTQATITVHDETEALVFEVVGIAARSASGFQLLRDRVEALDGRLDIESEPGRTTRFSGTLPLSRRG